MAKSVLCMSMSLDGFITGPDDGPGNGLGAGGNRLHEWLGQPISGYPHFDPPGLSGQVVTELMATGAVVVGRKTFDYAGHWDGDHHGVPIFVPTRGTPPAPQSGWVLASFEDTTIDSFRTQVDTNFYGVVNVSKAGADRRTHPNHTSLWDSYSMRGRNA